MLPYAGLPTYGRRARNRAAGCGESQGTTAKSLLSRLSDGGTGDLRGTQGNIVRTAVGGLGHELQQEEKILAQNFVQERQPS